MGKTTSLMAASVEKLLTAKSAKNSRQGRKDNQGAFRSIQVIKFLCDLRTPFAILAVKGFALVSSSMRTEELLTAEGDRFCSRPSFSHAR
jgi:hypothetical protein